VPTLRSPTQDAGQTPDQTPDRMGVGRMCPAARRQAKAAAPPARWPLDREILAVPQRFSSRLRSEEGAGGQGEPRATSTPGQNAIELSGDRQHSHRCVNVDLTCVDRLPDARAVELANRPSPRRNRGLTAPLAFRCDTFLRQSSSRLPAPHPRAERLSQKDGVHASDATLACPPKRLAAN
jgi:hypothetical protein